MLLIVFHALSACFTSLNTFIPKPPKQLGSQNPLVETPGLPCVMSELEASVVMQTHG